MNVVAKHLLLSVAFGLLSLFALFPLSNGIAADVVPLDLPLLAKRVSPSVLRLSVHDATQREIASGTGFIVSEDGRVVTNHHVIKGAASITAKADNGASYAVEGILIDAAEEDLAVLKLAASRLPVLSLGDSGKVQVGDRIAVVGSPLGLENTLSDGIVSARRKMESGRDWLQITAPISPGSSGSPVVNQRGEVVGVATKELKGGQALNFAQPVERVIALLASVAQDAQPVALSKRQSAGEAKPGVDPISEDPDHEAFEAAILHGGFAKGLKHIRKALERHPTSAKGHADLALCYRMTNYKDEAVAAFKQSLKLDPTQGIVWLNLGALYAEMGRQRDAISAFRAALTLTDREPVRLVCLRGLADIYAESDFAAALRTSLEIVKLAPDDTTTWSWIVTYSLYGETSDFAQAEKAIEQLQRLDPKLAARRKEELIRRRGK